MSQGEHQGEHQEEAAAVRRCEHYRQQRLGADYGGEQYVDALHRLRASAAVAASRKVEPFFWHDAPKVRVWLCADCARELGL